MKSFILRYTIIISLLGVSSCLRTGRRDVINIGGGKAEYKLRIGDELAASGSCFVRIVSIKADYVEVQTSDGVAQINRVPRESIGGLVLACNLVFQVVEIDLEKNFIIASAVKRPRPSLFDRLIGPPF